MVRRDDTTPRAENLKPHHIEGIHVDNGELLEACFQFRNEMNKKITDYETFSKRQQLKCQIYNGINVQEFLKTQDSAMLGALKIEYDQGSPDRYMALSGSRPVTFFTKLDGELKNEELMLNGKSYLFINDASFHQYFADSGSTTKSDKANLFNVNGEKTNFKIADMNTGDAPYCAAKKMLAYFGFMRNKKSTRKQIKAVRICEIWFKNPQSLKDVKDKQEQHKIKDKDRKWSPDRSVQPCNGCKVLLPLLRFGVKEIEEIFFIEPVHFPRNKHCIPFELLNDSCKDGLKLRLRRAKNEIERKMKELMKKARR